MHQTKQWHMLDYVLMNWKFRTSIHDTRAYRYAAGGIGTDHHLLRTKVKIHLKCRQKGVRNNRLRLDTSKLNDDTRVKDFRIMIEVKSKTLYSSHMSIDEKYRSVADCIHQAGEQLFRTDTERRNNE